MSDAARAAATLNLTGGQIRHHLIAAARHDEKAAQHKQSAALLLIEAKSNLPHGGWYPWLQQHGISPRTAQLLLQEHDQPDAAAALREKKNEQEREVRANAKRASHFTPPPQPKVHDPVYEKPTPRQPREAKAEVPRLGHVRAHQLLDKLTDEQVRRVIEFIDQL